MIWNII